MAMSDRKVDGRPNPHLEILKDNTEVYVETLFEDSYYIETMYYEIYQDPLYKNKSTYIQSYTNGRILGEEI